MLIKVYIMSGAGNIFSVIDNRKCNFPQAQLSELAIKLCRKSDYIKRNTEGLIVLNEGNDEVDFNSLFFNPDGSCDAMCGNGGRCAVHLASKIGLINLSEGKEFIYFDMAGNVYKSKLKDDTIFLYLPLPNELIVDYNFDIFGENIQSGYVDVGSRHIVINFDKIKNLVDANFQDFNLNKFGPLIRYHQCFVPHGVNVNIFQINDNNNILLRTYERGVEAETGACGTGAISTAIVAHKKFNLPFPIKIIPTSGIPLIIALEGESLENANSIILEGPAEILEEIEVEF